jgi:hypothetical protein
VCVCVCVCVAVTGTALSAYTLKLHSTEHQHTSHHLWGDFGTLNLLTLAVTRPVLICEGQSVLCG